VRWINILAQVSVIELLAGCFAFLVLRAMAWKERPRAYFIQLADEGLERFLECLALSPCRRANQRYFASRGHLRRL